MPLKKRHSGRNKIIVVLVIIIILVLMLVYFAPTIHTTETVVFP